MATGVLNYIIGELVGGFAGASSDIKRGIGGANAIVSQVNMQERRATLLVRQTLWYGKVTMNILTNDIINVQQSKITTGTYALPEFSIYQERIYSPVTNYSTISKNIIFGEFVPIHKNKPQITKH
ncbi:hypothetical protein [Flavobacterium sp. ov086]|uniref:hypothetical protein n=1 Tax=Flavobacterium sp. ov086 TaxID=1761785 RepID=UPI000B6949D8|nr:hypothetical protein [Flavobacterium sp. ov086]SNS04914.1 hypothetical protein SAMN04487979_1563 [Flavobacterium sp. ov086]